MKKSTTKAYAEVIELLKYFSIEQVKKIPETKLNVFFKFRDKTYNYKVDETKSFFEQDMMPETKAIFTILFEDYWATDEQMKILKKKEKEAFKELEDKKRNLYNPDNLFKNKKENSKIIEEKITEEVALVECHESLFKKIWNKILSIFKR